jgi:hypothetical protein
MLMDKFVVRKEVVAFCKVFYAEYLKYDIGMLPSFDSSIRKLTIDNNALDFFSADELKREFFVYSGLSEDAITKVGLEFPNDLMPEINTGSEDGLMEWLGDNVNKACKDKNASRMWIVDIGDDHWFVVFEHSGLSKEAIIKAIEDSDEELKPNENKCWLFRVGERAGTERDKWFDLFDVLTKWGTKKVDTMVYEDEEAEEGFVVNLKDLLKDLYEGMSLDVLYKGAIKYKIIQPGEVDRHEHGEDIVSHITDLRMYPYWGTKELMFTAKVRSETEATKVYNAKIIFMHVDMSHEFDEYTPVKGIDSKTEEEFWFQFLPTDSEVRVYCTCMDSNCRFAKVLKAKKAWQGNISCPPRRTNRKSINVGLVPAICKHVIAIVELLMRGGVISNKLSSGKEIDTLVKGVYI